MSEIVSGSNPYVGLRPFQTEDSLFFFGRGKQTAELLDLLHEHRFLAIVGSSGSGKSSLVRAGLLPRLHGGFLVHDADHWRIAHFRPGDAPIANFVAAMLNTMGAEATAYEQAECEQAVREGHTDAVLAYLAPRMGKSSSVFLLVDQFEELFAFRGDDEGDDQDRISPAARHERTRRKAEAAAFVDLMLALSQQQHLSIFVALTMRSDFLGDCDLFYGLPEALNRARYLVPRLTRQELRESIEGPALLMRAKFAPRLLDQLLNELGDRFDRLPVLQHALLRTWDAWQRDGGKGPIDLGHFESIGGLEYALSIDADQVLVGLDRTVAARLFKRLTDTDASQRRVRRPARLSDLTRAAGAPVRMVQEILGRFREDNRNFVNESDDGMPADPRFDIMHESLIRQWDTLRTWVDEERQSRDQFRRLVERARDHERQQAGLLQDPDLQVALDWKEAAAPTPSWAVRYEQSDGDYASAIQFLDASHAEALAQKARATRENVRKLTRLGALAAVFFVVATWALLQRAGAVRAQERTGVATQLSLAASLSGTDPTAAALVLAELPDLDSLSAAESGVLREATGSDIATAVLRTPGGAVNWAAYSPDGQHVVTGGEDGTVRIWPWNGRAPKDANGVPANGLSIPAIVVQHARAVRRAEYSSDGTHLLTTSWDGTARVWQVNASGATTGTPVVLGDSLGAAVGNVGKGNAYGAVLSAEFSPDGRRIVTASTDRTVRVWDLTGTEQQRFEHGGDVTFASFNPGGTQIVTASNDGPGKYGPRVWFVSGRREIKMCLHSVAVQNAKFSPDGKWVATESADGVARLCATDDSGRMIELSGHTRKVNAASFSRDSKRVVTASDDSTARVYSIDSVGKPPVVLRGHENLVRTAAFSPDGSSIVTASYDGTARLWNADGKGRPVVLRGHAKFVSGAWFSPDGHYVLTASMDGTARVWRTSGHLELRWRGVEADLRKGHTGMVHGASFNAKGDQIVSLSQDSTARIWNVFSHDPPLVLRHTNQLHTAFFNSDGTRVLTASNDGKASIWSADSGKLLHDLKRSSSSPTFSARFNNQGTKVVTSYADGSVLVWPANGVGDSVLLGRHGKEVYSALFDAAGTRVLTASWDGTARIWPVDAGAKSVSFIGHRGSVNMARFSPDERLVATASNDSTAIVWLVDNPERKIVFRHSGAVVSVAFSPDSRRIVTASWDSTVRVWNADGTGTPVVLRGHEDKMISAAFSPDGNTVLSTSWDRTARLWPADGLGEPDVMRGPASVLSAAFGNNGSRIVTTAYDGSVALWRPPVIDSLRRTLRESTSDCLPVEFRVLRLGEKERDAKDKYKKCEQSFGRSLLP